MNRRTLMLLTATTLLAATLRANGDASEAAAIVSHLTLERGQAVAVTGPGVMVLVPLLSERIGPDGYVFVVDTDTAVLGNLRHQIEESKLTNTMAIAGNANDLLLPHTVDLVVLYNSYHHIARRSPFFAKLRKYLRADASIAIIDYYRRPMKVGPPWKERVSSSRAMTEMARFGFKLAERHRVSPYRYFLVYRVARR